MVYSYYDWNSERNTVLQLGCNVCPSGILIYRVTHQYISHKQKYMQGGGVGVNKTKSQNHEPKREHIGVGGGQNIDGAFNIITNLRQPVHPDVSRVLIDKPGPIHDIIASLEFFLRRSWSRIHFTS